MSVNGWSEPSSITPSTCSSNRTGSTMMFAGASRPSPDSTLTYFGDAFTRMLLRSTAACPTSPSPKRNDLAVPLRGLKP